MLLLGLGIAVGVMITLLSIGDAVLEQARDKDLVGGGDVVLLPPGIDVEVMKVGGVTGMYYTLNNARYLYRQVLSGPRFAPLFASVTPEFADLPLAAASPTLADKVVYVRKVLASNASEPLQARAHGFIPSLDRAAGGPSSRFPAQGIVWSDHEGDRLWADPPVDALYNELDRFHLPGRTQADRDRWGEWLYFNFADSLSDTYGYVSFIAGSDIEAGAGRASPLLQIQKPDAPPLKYGAEFPLSRDDISLSHVDLRFGDETTAQFRNGAWRLDMNWNTEDGPVRGALTVTPVRDLYFPPFVIHESERFVSGYSVPALRAHVTGFISAPGVQLELQEAVGYHDHNWGTWRNVHWDWGTSSTEEYALLYGRVLHPELRSGQSLPSVFLMLSKARTPEERGGLLGMFRPALISYEWETQDGLPGNPERVPRRIVMSAGRSAAQSPIATSAASDSIHVVIDVTRVAATPPNADDDNNLVFLQLRGRYQVTAWVGENRLYFDAAGFSEVFVPTGAPGFEE